MSDIEAHGPIDFVLLEFHGDNVTGRAARELQALVDQGTIRLYDLVVIRKDQDGSFSGLALDELDPSGEGGFAAFAGARSGLLGDDDLKMAADAMEPGTVAALLVYENAWAIPFVVAAREAGGSMIASARIPAQDVMDALDALDSAG